MVDDRNSNSVIDDFRVIRDKGMIVYIVRMLGTLLRHPAAIRVSFKDDVYVSLLPKDKFSLHVSRRVADVNMPEGHFVT